MMAPPPEERDAFSCVVWTRGRCGGHHLKAPHQIVLQTLGTYPYGLCAWWIAWPSIPTLAAETGYAESTIYDAIKALESHGLLERIPHTAPGRAERLAELEAEGSIRQAPRGQSTVYHFFDVVPDAEDCKACLEALVSKHHAGRFGARASASATPPVHRRGPDPARPDMSPLRSFEAPRSGAPEPHPSGTPKGDPSGAPEPHPSGAPEPEVQGGNRHYEPQLGVEPEQPRARGARDSLVTRESDHHTDDRPSLAAALRDVPIEGTAVDVWLERLRLPASEAARAALKVILEAKCTPSVLDVRSIISDGAETWLEGMAA